MIRKTVLCAILLGVVALPAARASAQDLISTRHQLSSYAARRMIDACLDYAQKNHITELAIAVVDPNGNLLAFQATEGATEAGITTSQLKARTAARWRRTTEDLFNRVNKQINRAPQWLGDFPQPGGFPIFVDGEEVGAIGGGGGHGTQDDDCARAAVQMVFGNRASLQRAP